MTFPSAKKRRHAEIDDPSLVAVVIVHRSLGQLLPESYDSDRRSLRYCARHPTLYFPQIPTQQGIHGRYK